MAMFRTRQKPGAPEGAKAGRRYGAGWEDSEYEAARALFSIPGAEDEEGGGGYDENPVSPDGAAEAEDDDNYSAASGGGDGEDYAAAEEDAASQVFHQDDSQYLWCYVNQVSLQGRLYFKERIKIDDTTISNRVASFNLLIKKKTKNGIKNHRIYIKTYNKNIIEWLTQQKVGAWVRVEGRLEAASSKTYVNATSITAFSEERIRAIFGDEAAEAAGPRPDVDWKDYDAASRPPAAGRRGSAGGVKEKEDGDEGEPENNVLARRLLRQIKQQARTLNVTSDSVCVDEDENPVAASGAALSEIDIENITRETRYLVSSYSTEAEARRRAELDSKRLADFYTPAEAEEDVDYPDAADSFGGRYETDEDEEGEYEEPVADETAGGAEDEDEGWRAGGFDGYGREEAPRRAAAERPERPAPQYGRGLPQPQEPQPTEAGGEAGDGRTGPGRGSSGGLVLIKSESRYNGRGYEPRQGRRAGGGRGIFSSSRSGRGRRD